MCSGRSTTRRARYIYCNPGGIRSCRSKVIECGGVAALLSVYSVLLDIMFHTDHQHFFHTDNKHYSGPVYQHTWSSIVLCIHVTPLYIYICAVMPYISYNLRVFLILNRIVIQTQLVLQLRGTAVGRGSLANRFGGLAYEFGHIQKKTWFMYSSFLLVIRRDIDSINMFLYIPLYKYLFVAVLLQPIKAIRMHSL